MYSEKDREVVLNIREMFSKDGEMPEYREEFNLIRVPIEGDYDIHPLLIKCSDSVLSIFSAKAIDAKNSSEKALKHIMNLNFRINMGGFHYITERDCFMFKMSVPLCEKPEKAFLGGLLKYAIDVLDDYVPEIISCINNANHWKKEGVSPTFH